MSKETERKTVEIIIKGQQANSSLKEMQSAARLLNSELRKLPANSAQFAEKSKELQQVNKRLKKIQDDVKGVGGVFGQISKEVKAFGLLAIAALGFQAITSGVSNLINQNAKLSDSFADIRKTTGMTEVEVKRLNNAFSQMDTRTSTKDLREIAIAAGQLGIAKKDILSFSSATDKLVVSLGDEFKGGAEEVTKVMGSLRTVFSDIKSNNIADDMLHIGNAVNELAASGRATGPVVSDFANRIGGVGINLGLTSGQVLGLSATLQELNVSTERGGTAISKILMKMTQDTDKFAEVAGMSTNEFTELVNKDLYGAFIKVAEGSKKTGTSATSFSKILDTLGVDGAGASEVFSKLGSNTALLKEKVDLANVSLKGTDSIMNEFNLKNQTFGAKIEKISKSLVTAFVNGPIMKGLSSMADGILKLTRNTHAASEAMAEEQNQIELSKIKILSYNVGNTERTKLLKELKDQYPDYLANLDAEKASNDQVREAIDAVVNSLVNRIVVQRKQEEIAEQAENIADKKEKQLQAEAELLEALRKAYKDNEDQRKRSATSQVVLMSKELEGLPIMVQAQALLDAKNSGLSRMNQNVVGVSEALENMKKAEIAYNSESMKGNDIQREKDELMNRLGINKPGTIGGDVTAATKIAAEIAAARTEEEIKANEKIENERNKLSEKLAEVEIEYFKKGLDASTKEIAEVHYKYAKLLKEFADFSEAKMQVQKLYTKEIEDVLHKQAVEEQKRNAEKLTELHKLQDEIYLATLSANDKELVAEMQKWEEIILKAEQAGLDVTALRQAEADAINAIVVKQGEKEIQETEKTNKKLIALNKEKIDRIIEAVTEFGRLVNNIMDTYDTVQSNREEEGFRKNEKRLNDEAKNNEKLLNTKSITQREYDQRMILAKELYDKENDALELEAFKRQQKMERAKILIATAVAIAQVWAKYWEAPPVALGYSAVIAAEMGLQLTALDSVPEPYAEGGFNKSDDPQGFTKGPTLFTKSASGSPFIAGEAGEEWISPSWMVKHPETAPIIEHLETIRQTRAFASGGSNQNSTAKPTFAKQSDTYNNSGNDKLSKSIDRLNQNLESGVIAYLDYDGFRRTLDKIDGAEKASRVG